MKLVTELRYADDTALFSTTPDDLKNVVQALPGSESNGKKIRTLFL